MSVHMYGKMRESEQTVKPHHPQVQHELEPQQHSTLKINLQKPFKSTLTRRSVTTNFYEIKVLIDKIKIDKKKKLNGRE